MNLDKLLLLRRKYKLTQEEIANQLGITAPAYSMKESGKQNFTAEQISKLFKYFQKLEPQLNMQDIFL